MIILEGPDGGGKTTLLEALANEIPTLAVMPKAVDPNGAVTLDIGTYIGYHTRLGFGPRLYDRFATISGPIYGSINYMAAPNDIFKDRQFHFQAEAVLQAIRPLIIYCLPDLEIVRLNLESDEDSSKVVGANIENIYYQYQSRAARDFSAGVGVIYDYNNAADWNITVARIRLAFTRQGVTV